MKYCCEEPCFFMVGYSMFSSHYRQNMADQGAHINEADIQALNRFPEEPFSDFTKLVLNFLVTPKDFAELMSDLEAFAESIGASVAGIKNLVKSLISFLRDSARKTLSPELLQDRLDRLGLVSEKSIVLANGWKSNYIAICRSIVGQVFLINQLVDMEWKFGVTAETSDKNQVGHSFLQLKVIIDKGNNETEAVCMELTLPQFYSFLHEMEKARADLELLS